MVKIDRVGENKTQRLYRCCSNYALSKLIMDNGLEDLWRRENPDFPKFICFQRSFAKDQYRSSILIFGKGPMEADELGEIWILPSPSIMSRINHIMVSFTNHYNAISTDRLPSKTKIGKCS